MKGNLLGEDFRVSLANEIKLRQEVHGVGYAKGSIRNNNILTYLNTRNTWIKLASGASIDDVNGKEILKRIGFGEENINNYLGSKLAQNFILFNGTSKGNFSSEEEEGVSINKLNNYTSRSGITKQNKVLNDVRALYGGIGTKDFGLQPMPGIIDANIKCLNRGSIKEANINIKAFNKTQFEIIELLYLRLNMNVLLEWGWDKYIEKEENGYVTKKVENTLIEDEWFKYDESNYFVILDKIKNYQKRYNYNTDAFSGKVVNFSWSFEPDGSYLIQLKLISHGDVIESLRVNTSVTPSNSSLKGSDESPDMALTDVLSYKLYEGHVKNKNNFDDRNFYNFKITLYNKGIKTFKFDESLCQGSYVKFKGLLDIIESNILPRSEDNGISILSINSRNDIRANAFNAQLNQVSLNPNICIFKPIIEENELSFLKADNKSDIITICDKLDGCITKITAPNSSFQVQPPLAITTLDTTSPNGKLSTIGYVGNLMNIYLHLPFLFNLIKNKLDNKGNLMLFDFLKEICDNINRALGGLNNIEPIIDEDQIIKFIDKNPIPGAEVLNKDLKLPQPAVFNILGYNEKSDKSFESNFVKNLTFQTKISNELASMITIGATAGGSSTKNYDATAFAKWNQGINNRFNPGWNDPISPEPSLTNLSETDIEKEIINQLPLPEDNKDVYIALAREKFEKTDIINKFINFIVGTSRGERWGYNEDEGTYQLTSDSKLGNFVNSKIKEQKFENTESGENEFLVEVGYYIKVYENIESLKKEQQEQKLDKLKNSYSRWLVEAFGGKGDPEGGITEVGRGGGERLGTFTVTLQNLPSIPLERTKYLDYDSPDFYTKGINIYKEYINSKNNKRYIQGKEPSSTIGFIPVQFNMDIEGISGIKIYNSLYFQQDFLPYQYPKALSFITTGVDHKISNNDWVTSLKTISIPNVTLEESQLENIQIEEPSSPKDYRTITSGYDISSPNKDSGTIYFEESTPKTAVVIHHTAGWSYGDPAKSTVQTFVSRTRSNNYPIGTHYVITQAGKVEKVFDLKYWSYHSSISRNDKYTIGIELEALGWLTLENDGSYSQGNVNLNKNNVAKYIQYTDNKTATLENSVVKKEYRGKQYFQRYSEKQISALITVLEEIRSEYPDIDFRFDEDKMFPAKGKRTLNSKNRPVGLYSHNSSTEKIDVFPQEELINALKEFGEEESPIPDLVALYKEDIDNALGEMLNIAKKVTTSGTLDQFKNEYPKTYSALLTSRNNVKNFIEKLNDERLNEIKDLYDTSNKRKAYFIRNIVANYERGFIDNEAENALEDRLPERLRQLSGANLKYTIDMGAVGRFSLVEPGEKGGENVG